jgi:hypothetical protein
VIVARDPDDQPSPRDEPRPADLTPLPIHPTLELAEPTEEDRATGLAGIAQARAALVAARARGRR